MCGLARKRKYKLWPFPSKCAAVRNIRSEINNTLDLQRDLDKLALWEQLWKFSFHPDKCNVLIISRYNETPVLVNSIIAIIVMSWNRLIRQSIWELPSVRTSTGKTTSTTSVVKPIGLLAFASQPEHWFHLR